MLNSRSQRDVRGPGAGETCRCPAFPKEDLAISIVDLIPHTYIDKRVSEFFVAERHSAQNVIRSTARTDFRIRNKCAERLDFTLIDWTDGLGGRTGVRRRAAMPSFVFAPTGYASG